MIPFFATSVGRPARRSIFLVLTTFLFGSCAASSGGGDDTWRYRVTIEADGGSIAGEATFPPDVPRRLGFLDGLESFVEAVTLDSEEGPLLLAPREGVYEIPETAKGPLRLRWSFDVKAAAEARASTSVALRVGTAYVSPPSAWLIRPFDGKDSPVTLEVSRLEGLEFASGIFPAEPGGRLEFSSRRLRGFPYTVFGRFALRRFEAKGGGRVELACLPFPRAIDDDPLESVVRSAADAVAGFYGRFPVAQALVVVVPRGRSMHVATAMGNGGASVMLPISRRAGPREIEADWTLVHEMTHLAFPEVADRHHWIEEGLATYVEPLARVAAGIIDIDRHWLDMAQGLPQGLPEAGDQGLDRTPTWGRVYWGGALFCFLADLDIRERSRGRLSLRDALRALVADGRDISTSADLRRTLAFADEAVGGDSLVTLYDAMREDPHPVDLDAIWKDLGVIVDGDRVSYDDRAPKAWLRQSFP